MKNKKLFFLLVFIFVYTGVLYAQSGPGQNDVQNLSDSDNEDEDFPLQSESFFKPTISLGIISTEGNTNLGIALDVNYILPSRLTFGVKGGIFSNEGDGNWYLAAFGAGYMYNVDLWSLGGKGMVYSVDGFMGVGLDITGTYWFRPNLGITGTGGIMSVRNFTFFQLLAGLSMRF